MKICEVVELIFFLLRHFEVKTFKLTWHVKVLPTQQSSNQVPLRNGLATKLYAPPVHTTKWVAFPTSVYKVCLG